MADSRASRHFARALEELAFALAALVEEIGERTHARATALAALRAEERRWRARAADDAAAARVAEVFAALADVFDPPVREPRATRDTKRKFDPPRVRWDTRARWRS